MLDLIIPEYFHLIYLFIYLFIYLNMLKAYFCDNEVVCGNEAKCPGNEYGLLHSKINTICVEESVYSPYEELFCRVTLHLTHLQTPPTHPR